MDCYVTGAAIKQLREKRGMTQADLGRVIGVSDKAVSRWETGRGFPDITLIEPLSDSPLCRTLGGYADVFSLLFIIQLSVGAMFLLLIAQVIVAGNLTVMLR